MCAAVKEASDRMIQEQPAEDPADPPSTNPASANPAHPTKASCDTVAEDDRSEADSLVGVPASLDQRAAYARALSCRLCAKTSARSRRQLIPQSEFDWEVSMSGLDCSVRHQKINADSTAGFNNLLNRLKSHFLLFSLLSILSILPILTLVCLFRNFNPFCRRNKDPRQHA